MIFFKKLTAFLVVASFMFSSAFARIPSEEGRRTPTIKPRTKIVPLKPFKKEKKNTRRSAKKNARKANTQNKKGTKKARPHVKKVSLARRHNPALMEDAQNKRTVKKAKPAKTPKKVAPPLPVNLEQKTKAKKVAKAVKSPKPPVNVEKKVKAAKSSRLGKTTISTRDIPDDLRNDIEAILGQKIPDTKAKLKPQEINEALEMLQEIENRAPGITQRTRTYLEQRGYNPASDQEVTIYPALLPEELQHYCSLFMFDGEPSEISYTFSQVEITEMLNQMQQRETRIAGITQRVRTFLKSR